jgi:hypothetical protein
MTSKRTRRGRRIWVTNGIALEVLIESSWTSVNGPARRDAVLPDQAARQLPDLSTTAGRQRRKDRTILVKRRLLPGLLEESHDGS